MCKKCTVRHVGYFARVRLEGLNKSKNAIWPCPLWNFTEYKSKLADSEIVGDKFFDFFWKFFGHGVTYIGSRRNQFMHGIIAFKNSHAKISSEIRILRKNRMRKFAFCEKSHFAKNSHAKIRILRKIAFCENSQNFASLRKIFLRFFAFASLRKMILKFFRIRIASHFYIQCEGTSLSSTETVLNSSALIILLRIWLDRCSRAEVGIGGLFAD